MNEHSYSLKELLVEKRAIYKEIQKANMKMNRAFLKEFVESQELSPMNIIAQPLMLNKIHSFGNEELERTILEGKQRSKKRIMLKSSRVGNEDIKSSNLRENKRGCGMSKKDIMYKGKGCNNIKKYKKKGCNSQILSKHNSKEHIGGTYKRGIKGKDVGEISNTREKIGKVEIPKSKFNSNKKLLRHQNKQSSTITQNMTLKRPNRQPMQINLIPALERDQNLNIITQNHSKQKASKNHLDHRMGFTPKVHLNTDSITHISNKCPKHLRYSRSSGTPNIYIYIYIYIYI